MFSSKSISATQKRLLALSVKDISDNEAYNSDGQKSWNSDTNVINYIKKMAVCTQLQEHLIRVLWKRIY